MYNPNLFYIHIGTYERAAIDNYSRIMKKNFIKFLYLELKFSLQTYLFICLFIIFIKD